MSKSVHPNQTVPVKFYEQFDLGLCMLIQIFRVNTVMALIFWTV